MEEEAAQLGGAAESLTGLEVGGGESWGRPLAAKILGLTRIRPRLGQFGGDVCHSFWPPRP